MAEEVKKLETEVKTHNSVGGVSVRKNRFGNKEILRAWLNKVPAWIIRQLRDLRDDALTVTSPSDRNAANRVIANLQRARRTDQNLWPTDEKDENNPESSA